MKVYLCTRCYMKTTDPGGVCDNCLKLDSRPDNLLDKILKLLRLK